MDESMPWMEILLSLINAEQIFVGCANHRFVSSRNWSAFGSKTWSLISLRCITGRLTEILIKRARSPFEWALSYLIKCISNREWFDETWWYRRPSNFSLKAPSEIDHVTPATFCMMDDAKAAWILEWAFCQKGCAFSAGKIRSRN